MLPGFFVFQDAHLGVKEIGQRPEIKFRPHGLPEYVGNRQLPSRLKARFSGVHDAEVVVFHMLKESGSDLYR